MEIDKMKREVDLNEISDGRLYSSGDMVKVDCHDLSALYRFRFLFFS